MKLFPKSLSLALLSGLLALTGCVKKPQRPDPSSTVLGQTGGGLNGGFAGDLGGLSGGTDIGLENRGAGVYEDEDKITGLIQPIYFDFALFGIKESERAKIQEAKAHLDANPQHRILFEGHCDWRGTAEYNLGLGDRRANAAKSYLETLGIPASRIEVVSKGDIDAQENASDADMAKDRRADIIILKK